MYTYSNFKSKKALKEAVEKGSKEECFSPGPFPCPTQGWITLEGPHYPEPHKWYVQAYLENGIITKIK